MHAGTGPDCLQVGHCMHDLIAHTLVGPSCPGRRVWSGCASSWQLSQHHSNTAQQAAGAHSYKLTALEAPVPWGLALSFVVIMRMQLVGGSTVRVEDVLQASGNMPYKQTIVS